MPATEVDRTGVHTDDLDRLFGLSPALLCIAGADGYFKRVNPAFPKTLGHTEADLLSRPFIEFVHPGDRQATLNELGKLSDGIPAVHFENRYRHANGSYRWLLWNTTPVTEEGLLYATALDITDRKHANAMFRNLLDAAPDSIIIADHQGKILRINRETEVLFGYSSDELVGQSIEILVPARFRNRHREQRNGYTRDPRPRLMGCGIDQSGVRKDGSEFPAEISLGPVASEQGRVVICAVRDISLRKQRERELQERGTQLVENQRRLQALAARLALAEENERRRIARGLHDDVGQTLLAAKMSLDELQDRDVPELQRLLAHAIQSTRTLTFELASAALYDVGLGAALHSACERAEQESGIRFRPPSVSEGKSIPEEMRGIFYRAGLELIRNIVKHSRARTASLSLSRNGTGIRVTVEDDGRGFEVSKDRQCQGAGVGFGLFSITQQLDSIGGRLEIVSSPGAGTRAVITARVDAEEETR